MEFEVLDKLSVEGESIFRATVTVQSVSTQAYSAAFKDPSGNYTLLITTSGQVRAAELYQGGNRVIDSSMLDGFTLKFDTAANRIKIADRLEQNIMLDAFKIAVSSSLTKFNMADGIMDEFEDQSGVDLSSSTIITYDPAARCYVNQDAQTKLLLHANPPGFQDASSSSHVLTSAGSARIDTAQYKLGSSSLLLGGGGTDWGQVIANNDFNFSSGDFTIDCWFKASSIPNIDPTIFAGYHDLHFMLQLRYNSGSPKLILSIDDGTSPWNGNGFYAAMGSATISAGNWYHTALVRTGNTYKVYLNGTLDITQTKAINIGEPSGIRIGINENLGSYFSGWIDEFRVSKGIARWTTDFTVPSSEYASDSYTTLLLHFKGANGETSFQDSSSSAHTVTRAGHVYNDDSQKKLGPASYYFDGNDDYLISPDSDDWDFGTGDFTIDMWFRLDSGFSSGAIYDNCTFGGGGVRISIDSLTSISINVTVSSQQQDFSQAVSLSTLTWYHIALVRSAGYVSLYLNGVLQGAARNIPGSVSSSLPLKLGVWYYSYNGAWYGYFKGWLDEVRVSKGVARWTSGFSISTLAGEYSTGGNMSIVSAITSAEEVPSNVRLLLFEEDVDNVAVNSDLQGYVSRDNATWTPVTLSDEGNYQTGRRILSGVVNLSSQPSGQSMRWKASTFNNRILKLHGAGLSWD